MAKTYQTRSRKGGRHETKRQPPEPAAPKPKEK